MAHESDTATLGSGAEEGNLGLLLTELVGVELHGTPSGRRTSVLVVLEGGEVDTEASVSLDNASVANLEVRNQRGSEVTV